MSDVQVMAERPVDEALAVDRAQRRAEQPRRDPRDQPLHPQHPAEGAGVAGGEGVVAGERLLARLLTGQHGAQFTPARDPEVERGPIPSAVRGRQ